MKILLMVLGSIGIAIGIITMSMIGHHPDEALPFAAVTGIGVL